MKKKTKNKVHDDNYSRCVTHPVPNPARQSLTWVALLKNRERLPFVRKTRNSGENPNDTVHPWENFPEKIFTEISVQMVSAPSFATVAARYVFLVYVAIMYMNYPRCWDCEFLASFIRECTVLVIVYSYVAVEGVELTVHKESVVAEKIKEVELRSRRAQLFMTEIVIEFGYSLAPSRLPVKKLRRLLHKRRKVRVFVWKGIWKILFLNIPPHTRLIHNHDTEVYAPTECLVWLLKQLSACHFSFPLKRSFHHWGP